MCIRDRVFAARFNASTETQRAQAFGIEPGNWEIAREFIALHIDVREARKDRFSKTRRFFRTLKIAIDIAVVAALSLKFGPWAANALGFQGTAALIAGGAIGGFSSQLYLTGGDWEAAFEGGLRGAALAGLNYLRGLDELSTGQRVLAAVLSASVAGGNGSFQENLLAAFVDYFVDGVGEKLAALDNVSPFAGHLLERVLASALVNGGDWDKISNDVENFFFDTVGKEIADFATTSAIGSEWADVGKALTGFASFALASDADLQDSSVKKFFFDHVLPQMDWHSGGELPRRFGGRDELFEKVGGAVWDLSLIHI